jgi:purine nucleosidase
MAPRFPQLDPALRLQRLQLPPGPLPVVIDTDTANEIDDQFALAWAALAPERITLQAVLAEPFSFEHRQFALGRVLRDPAPFNPPAQGMRRSVDEARRILSLLPGGLDVPVWAGSCAYLASPTQPRSSDAATQLVSMAMAQPATQPLVVLALGCVTNIASALLLEPRLVERLVVVWTSGYPSHAPHANASFNLEQDVHATRVLLDSGVPLVYLPGFHVGAQLRLSLPEMERWVQGQGALGDALHHLFTHNPLWELQGIDSFFAHSWVMWDLICVAWLLNADWVPTTLVPTPRLGDDLRWMADPSRPLMREGHAVRRDAIFADFFQRLAAAAQADNAASSASA